MKVCLGLKFRYFGNMLNLVLCQDVSKDTLERTVSFWEEKLYWAQEGVLYFCFLLAQRPL